jgi:selenocysteine-specific elongation factor
MGGGVVVDPFPPKRRKADAGAPLELARLEGGDLEGRIETIVSACGDRGIGGEKLAKRLAVRWGDLVGPLDRLASRGPVLVLGGGGGALLLSAAGLETLAGRCRELLAEFHRDHPLLPGYPLEEFRSRLAGNLSSEEVRAVLGQLERRGAVRIDRDVAALPGHQVSLDTEQSRLSSAIASVFLKGGLAPPDVSEVLRDAGAAGPKGEGVLAHLLREGTLRRLRDGRVFHAQALAELRRKLSEYKAKSPTIDVAGFKDLTGISRKHAIPLLEYLDEERVTVRRGNERVILS